MFKQLLIAPLCLAAASAAASATGASLTEAETRWLRAAEPVLAWSQRLALPIDIIVQPKAREGDVPLALGFAGGRCKLVLSLRGNEQAEAVLEAAPPAGRALLIEAMAAHEVAHCWRHAQGAWRALPAGFAEHGRQAGDPALLAEARALREKRREEGFADLVALAWTWRRHPAEYARVHGWLAALRAPQPVAGGAHDTRAWVRLAADPARFGQDASPFDDAASLWREGLLAGNQED